VFRAACKKLSAVDIIGNIAGNVEASDDEFGEELDEKC
jgi:hypothetical protein